MGLFTNGHFGFSCFVLFLSKIVVLVNNQKSILLCFDSKINHGTKIFLMDRIKFQEQKNHHIEEIQLEKKEEKTVIIRKDKQIWHDSE